MRTRARAGNARANGPRPAAARAAAARRAPVAAASIVACLGAAFLAVAEVAPIPLDAATAADGLKEALGIGTSRSVDLLGRPDGYLKNVDVHIPMPDKLHYVDKSLRMIGKGNLPDEFVTSMNRAAEAAAPLARDVFLDTIKKMSFTDAMRIVRGRGHEATDYLRQNSGPTLGTRFRPIVVKQLNGVGTTKSFNTMMRKAPFVGQNAFNLEDYVTDRALAGLFFMIGREEERIRKDPVARTTSLLKTVFGASAGSAKKQRTWEKLLPLPSPTP
ncbi:MAG TPA: DUF4197 domain-containing protein [Candidatus Polarisedimenticolia bacterium]|nr:DUF4197 domain-containing protein [Candidatus Polarisedimenticolia bacterium]